MCRLAIIETRAQYDSPQAMPVKKWTNGQRHRNGSTPLACFWTFHDVKQRSSVTHARACASTIHRADAHAPESEARARRRSTQSFVTPPSPMRAAAAPQDEAAITN